jgi:transcriptional regulator with XRE-family HTH domain
MRMKLSQATFGKLGGVSRLAQWKYENGDSMPSVEYLLALTRESVDVGYLLYGRRHAARLLDLDTALEALRLVLRSVLDPSKAPTSERVLAAFESVCVAVIEDKLGSLNSSSTEDGDDVSQAV